MRESVVARLCLILLHHFDAVFDCISIFGEFKKPTSWSLILYVYNTGYALLCKVGKTTGF